MTLSIRSLQFIDHKKDFKRVIDWQCSHSQRFKSARLLLQGVSWLSVCVSVSQWYPTQPKPTPSSAHTCDSLKNALTANCCHQPLQRYWTSFILYSCMPVQLLCVLLCISSWQNKTRISSHGNGHDHGTLGSMWITIVTVWLKIYNN